MSRERSAAEQQVADLLHTARTSLRLSVAFLSRLDGTTQHLEVVESSVPFLFKEGVTAAAGRRRSARRSSTRSCRRSCPTSRTSRRR